MTVMIATTLLIFAFSMKDILRFKYTHHFKNKELFFVNADDK